MIKRVRNIVQQIKSTNLDVTRMIRHAKHDLDIQRKAKRLNEQPVQDARPQQPMHSAPIGETIKSKVDI